MFSVVIEKKRNTRPMRRRKNNVQRADEWAMNTLVAAEVSDSYENFIRIRQSRKEISSASLVSKEYYVFLISVLKGLKEPRSFSKDEFDDWFSCTCSSSGHKNNIMHVRVPAVTGVQKKEFAEVLWMWVQLIRSRDISVHWRYFQ